MNAKGYDEYMAPLVGTRTLSKTVVRNSIIIISIVVVMGVILYSLEDPKNPNTISLLLVLTTVFTSTILMYAIISNNLTMKKTIVVHGIANITLIILITVFIISNGTSTLLLILLVISEFGLFILNLAPTYFMMKNKPFQYPYSISK